MHEKGPYAICGQRRPFNALAGGQQSMDTVVYVDEQRMPSSDCKDSHAHVDLRLV